MQVAFAHNEQQKKARLLLLQQKAESEIEAKTPPPPPAANTTTTSPAAETSVETAETEEPLTPTSVLAPAAAATEDSDAAAEEQPPNGTGSSDGSSDGGSVTPLAPAAAPESSIAVKPQPEQMVDDYGLFEVCSRQSSLPASLDEKQQSHQQRVKAKQPVGLINTGNSCYASSTLQCLLATAPLAAYLRSDAHSISCCKPNPSTWCLLCELSTLAQRTQLSQSLDRDPVNPRDITRNIRRLCSSMVPGRQEDAHELFCKLLECMAGVSIAAAGGKKHLSPCSQETTLAHHLFGGYTRNSTTCTECDNVSQVFQSMSDLQLDIDPSMGSVEACLDGLFAAEWFEGENMYRCDRCATLVRASKQLSIEVAPNVLTVCLKRFGVSRQGKNKQMVAYPLRLSLDRYLADSAMDEGPADYRLFAVLVHVDKLGSTTSGHYIALVCGDDGRWWKCDDDEVDEISAAKALSFCAYLLFYIRDTPRPAPTMKPQAVVAVAVAAAPDPSALEEQDAKQRVVAHNGVGNGNRHSSAEHALHAADGATASQPVQDPASTSPGRVPSDTTDSPVPVQRVKPRKVPKQAPAQQPLSTFPEPRHFFKTIKPTSPTSIPVADSSLSKPTTTLANPTTTAVIASDAGSSAGTLPATLYVNLSGIRSVNDVQLCVVGKHLHLVAKVGVQAATLSPHPTASSSDDGGDESGGEASAGIDIPIHSNGRINGGGVPIVHGNGSSTSNSGSSNEAVPVEQQCLVLHLVLKQQAVLKQCSLRMKSGQLKVQLGAVSASAKKHRKKREAKQAGKTGAQDTNGLSSSNGDGPSQSCLLVESYSAASSSNSDNGQLEDSLC